MTINWTLQVGHILTDNESVTVLYDEPHLFVIEVDLTSKYAEVLGSRQGLAGHDGHDTIEFVLMPGERTIRCDEDAGDRYTELRVHRPDIGSWSFMQEVTRYTWRIVGYDQRYAYDR